MRRPLPALLAALLVGALGCDSAVEIELPEEEPRLVLSALFEADSLLTLDLRQSASALDEPSIEDVADATVEVFEDGAPVGTATYAEFRLRYVTDVRPRPGRTYRVRVSAPGFGPVEAEDAVPEPVPFEVVSVERGPEPTGGRDREDVVTVRFTDPPGDDHYALYGLATWSYPGRDYEQTFPLGYRSASPALADGGLDGLLGETEAPRYVRALFRDTPFEGETVTIKLEVRRQDASEYGGEVEITERLRLARVSETYYRYVRAIEADGGAGPFGDRTRTPSNVEGGYGIFAGFTATERALPQD